MQNASIAIPKINKIEDFEKELTVPDNLRVALPDIIPKQRLSVARKALSPLKSATKAPVQNSMRKVQL